MIFYLEGHKTERRVYEIVRDTVWRERFQMVDGQETPIEQLSKPPVPPRPPEAVARQEQRERHPEESHPRAKRRYAAGTSAERSGAGEGELGDLDLRGEPARLALVVIPGDASVYLDGKLLGAAADLVNRDGDLIVDPGTHKLELLRPGYQPVTREITVKPGELLSLDIAMEKQD